MTNSNNQLLLHENLAYGGRLCKPAAGKRSRVQDADRDAPLPQSQRKRIDPPEQPASQAMTPITPPQIPLRQILPPRERSMAMGPMVALAMPAPTPAASRIAPRRVGYSTIYKFMYERSMSPGGLASLVQLQPDGDRLRKLVSTKDHMKVFPNVKDQLLIVAFTNLYVH